jgi:hypothetical protein
VQQFDDGLPERRFDNFQFVNFHKEVSYGGEEFGAAYFAVAALQVRKAFPEWGHTLELEWTRWPEFVFCGQEVPDQYYAICQLELL